MDTLCSWRRVYTYVEEDNEMHEYDDFPSVLNDKLSTKEKITEDRVFYTMETKVTSRF